MEVNPLVCWFFGGCERSHLGFAHDHCAQLYEFLGVVGALLIRSLKLNPRPAHQGRLSTFKAEDIFDAHPRTSKRGCGGSNRVETTWDGDSLPQSISAEQIEKDIPKIVKSVLPKD